MQRARPAHLLQLAAQAAHPLADHAPVGLDLRFAGAAEEAEAAALPFEVGPAADQPALLVVEMREFDLQAALRRRRAFTEDFEDQARPVDDLALQPVFEVALLDGAERTVDDDQLGLMQFAVGRDSLDLTGTEQSRWLRLANRQDIGLGDDQPDREREALCLFHPAFGREVSALPGGLRTDHQRTRAARYLIVKFVVDYQRISSRACSAPYRLSRRRSRRSDRPA